jgi:Na+/H+ antiporter NhaC
VFLPAVVKGLMVFVVMLLKKNPNSTCGIIITYIITTGMKNNFKDNDVVKYKVIIGVSSCVAFNILLLIDTCSVYILNK